ncbi:MAG: BrnT family toxin [Geminicoccaceae bacterium]
MFEWDDDKNRRNLEKHGVAFEDVLSVFASREALNLEDRRKDYGEPRYIVLCPLEDVLVHVTYTVRGGSIRLISAPRASRREKRDYERRRPHEGGADPGRPRPD